MSRECQSLGTCPSLGGRHLVKIRRRWNLPILFGAFVPLDPRPYVEGDTGHLLAAQAALARVHPRATLRPSSLRSSASYRSAISYLDEEQRRMAYDTIADVEASGLWPGKVVTEVTPAGAFWEAEPEHQDYLEPYPNGYTCHFPRPDWVLPRRTESVPG